MRTGKRACGWTNSGQSGSGTWWPEKQARMPPAGTSGPRMEGDKAGSLNRAWHPGPCRARAVELEHLEAVDVLVTALSAGGWPRSLPLLALGDRYQRSRW